MIEKFWSEKKYLIEITGLVLIVSSLFLNINIPTDERTKTFLFNIQFFWFGITIISILALTNSFTDYISRHFEGKWFRGGLNWALFTIDIWFSINLWQYFFALYEKPLSLFFEQNYPIAALLFSLFTLNLISKIENKIRPSLFLVLQIVPIAGLIASILLKIVSYFGFPENVFFWSKLFLGDYILILIILFGLRLWKKKTH